jgi:hypothetical protein
MAACLRMGSGPNSMSYKFPLKVWTRNASSFAVLNRTGTETRMDRE